MSSFVALAGLFILLDADLLAIIQIMMNVGGMLVMILFMVMIMMDPGGEMMWDMQRQMHMRGPGAFSMSMPRHGPPDTAQAHGREREHEGHGKGAGDGAAEWTCPMHPEVRQDRPGQCPKCGMDLIQAEDQPSQHDPQRGENGAAAYSCPMHPEVRQQEPGTCPKCGMDLVPAEPMPQPGGEAHAARDKGQEPGAQHGMPMGGMSPRQHYQMMVDMAMTTAQLPWALAIGGTSLVALVVLLMRTPWPLSSADPSRDATVAVGELVLSRYMIGFEGAAFLILAGIAGAVIFAKRERRPQPRPTAERPAADGEAYTCPMHPQVRQRGPGECPLCGMALTPAESTVAASSSESEQGGAS